MDLGYQLWSPSAEKAHATAGSDADSASAPGENAAPGSGILEVAASAPAGPHGSQVGDTPAPATLANAKALAAGGSAAAAALSAFSRANGGVTPVVSRPDGSAQPAVSQADGSLWEQLSYSQDDDEEGFYEGQQGDWGGEGLQARLQQARFWPFRFRSAAEPFGLDAGEQLAGVDALTASPGASLYRGEPSSNGSSSSSSGWVTLDMDYADAHGGPHGARLPEDGVLRSGSGAGLAAGEHALQDLLREDGSLASPLVLDPQTASLAGSPAASPVSAAGGAAPCSHVHAHMPLCSPCA